MKKIIIITLLFVTASAVAQKSTKKADKLFNRMWYKEAALLYEAAIEDDFSNKELLQRAGDSYFFNTDMKNANRWYEILISNHEKDVDPEYIFRYAHTLEGIGNHQAAKRWMKKFAKASKTNDARAQGFAQTELTVQEILNLEPGFELKNLSINTKYSDFGPGYYKDDLVYSSANDSMVMHTRIYEWNQQPFLNMYLGDINPASTDVTIIEEFSDKLNTRYHEATIAFTNDERTIYFTRNNYNGDLERDGDGTNHLKLYRAVLRIDENDKDKRERWTNVTELPFNSVNYSVGHPTLSADNKKLYFTSDMPGSIGATDIFVVDITERNDSITYSQPRNLGPTINTAGREMFPHITDQALYLASDGHLGLGGLDVFQSSIVNDEFKDPINLGAPLNSKMDDFGFIIKEEENIGFVCSNRENGKGDDDIYSFVRYKDVIASRVEQEPCLQAVKGHVANATTGERIATVQVRLMDSANKELETTITDINGAYQFKTQLDCETPYQVIASKTGYESREKPFVSLDISGVMEVPLGLETLNKLIVEENGMLKIKIGIIYFDLDKSYIRASDAAIELNKVVLLMTEYPDMVIKIESHTDSRAPDAYNLSLSDRRAKSTRDYIISCGIDARRIESAIGYGETQLINRCKDGVPCSEAEHQFNRRSEFIIIKM